MTSNTKAGSPLAAAAEAIQEGFENFEPEGAEDMIDFFDGMPGFFEDFASAMASAASNAEERMPVEPEVSEGLREIASKLAAIRDESQELQKTFRDKHETEIRRVEEPRANEQAWDVG